MSVFTVPAVLAACAAVFAAVNRGSLRRLAGPAGPKLALVAACCAPSILLTLAPAGAFAYYAAPFMWALAAAAALFEGKEHNPQAHHVLDLLLGTACVASFMMTGGNFTPILMAASLVILLALSAGIYAKIFNETALGALIFLLLAAAVADLVIFRGLDAWARVACAALTAGYICHRRAGPHDIRLAEKAIPVFLVQCFIIALLKNPLAGF